MAITQQLENGTGSQTQYTLLFPYVAAEDVKVTIGGVLQDQDDPTEGYEIDGEILTFLTAPPAGTDNIKIYRETDVESLRATFFAGSQLKAEDLNLNFNQTNYKNQETDNLVLDKWSKETATVYSTDAWDSDDDVVATTEAIDNRIDSKVDSALTTDVVAGDGLTITDNSPASGQITVGITNSGVTTAKIADSNVTTVKIADANITTAKIANSGVTTDKINNSAVTTAKIADSNVTTAKIADANVTTVKIADSNVTTAKIADGNVTTAKIADGNVTTIKVADSGITTDKIADSGVTTAKIADGNVTSSKVANSNITTEKIADSGITTAKIADSNVTTAKIADANVTTAKIADSAVTASKILDASISAEKLTDATIVTDAEQAASTPNDTSFFTTSAANTRFVNATGDTMSGVLNMGSNLISDVADPVTNSDAATKGWVASQIASGTVADATYGDIEVSNAGTTWELVAGAISNDDINSSAGIDPSKIYGTAVTLIDTGTVTSTMIADGTIVDGDVSASAAIAGTKISPDFGNQNTTTTGTSTAASFIPTSSTVPTNGTYLSAVNQLSFATNTNERLRIDASGQIEAVSLGTASAPAYSWTGDPNTGIYSPGADQVAVSTNGSNRLHIDSSGNVGIGTTSPGTLLSVGAGSIANRTAIGGSSLSLLAGGYASTGAGSSIELGNGHGDSGNTASWIMQSVVVTGGGVTRNNHLTFSTRTAFSNVVQERLRITPAGDVGIGTTSVDARLHVSTSSSSVTPNPAADEVFIENATQVGLTFGSATDARIAFGDSGDEQAGLIYYNHASDYLRVDTAGSERLRIDSSGNVGIGTTSTPDRLVVYGTDPALSIFSDSTSGQGDIFFRDSGAAAGRIRYLHSDDAMLFFTQAQEKARLDSSGRLLAGTDTSTTLGPAQCLIQAHSTSRGVFGGAYYGDDALGPLLVLGKSRGTTVGSYNAVNDDDNVGAIIFAAADGTDLNSQVASIKAEIDAPPGSDDTPGRLIFSTTPDGSSTPNEQVTIDRNGNVGIGRYPTEKLDVYKASGRCVVEVDSDSLANGEISGFSCVGGARRGFIGIYKHAGITNPSSYIDFDREDGTNTYVWVDNSSVLRISVTASNIGTTSGTVVGQQTSDERIKNIIGPVEYGLDTLKQIETVRYSLKSEPEAEKIGFIAQQVQPLVPESVYDTGDHIEGEPEGAPTMLAMEYVALVPVLVNAVKELSAEVDALKAQLQTSNPN